MAMTNALVPVVHVVDGAVYANSREVADFFGKAHRDVLRETRRLVKALSAQNCAQWFVQTAYQARVVFVEGMGGVSFGGSGGQRRRNA